MLIVICIDYSYVKMIYNYIKGQIKSMTKYKVVFNDIDVSIVNGLRRVLLTDIEIPGFIGEALHDEIDDTIDIKLILAP